MIISHPHHDTFITIDFKVIDSTSSTITLFRIASPTPLMEHTFPFGIPNIAWFYQSPSKLSTDFSLVALTHKYSVVVMGNDVVLPQDPGASAKSLQKRPTAPQRSLFEEMFGVSAITPLTNPDVQTREAAMDLGSEGGVSVPWRSSDTTGFFDAPSPLMPPIETFFEPLIDSFLRLRTTDDETLVVQAEDGVAEADEDMQAETELVVPEVVVSSEAVLGVFVPLFKEMAGVSVR